MSYQWFLTEGKVPRAGAVLQALKKKLVRAKKEFYIVCYLSLNNILF